MNTSPTLIKQNKEIVIITDVKFDDVASIMALALSLDSTYKLTIVITNIYYVEKAADLLLQLLLVERTVEPEVNVFKGERNDPKSHEKSLYAKQAEIDAIGAYNVDLQTGPFTLIQLAPWRDTRLLHKAQIVFLGLGYNSKHQTIEDLQKINQLVLMNNIAGYQEGHEGGRFNADDEELWNAYYRITPAFQHMKECALVDSKAFMQKQLAKLGFEKDFREHHQEALEFSQKKHEEDPLNSYLFRVYDQLRTSVQIENTDLQHMVLWLTETNLKPVKLEKGARWIEIHECTEPSECNRGANVLCPMDLTTEHTRDLCVNYLYNLIQN